MGMLEDMKRKREYTSLDKCSKCGSKRIWSGYLDVIARGKVEFALDNLSTVNVRTSRLKSYACRDCGYVETYADTSWLNEWIEKFSK